MVAELRTSGRVSRDQRFTTHNPCPICAGGDGDKRGRGIRCWGYLGEGTAEGYVFCTNDDFSGSLTKRANGSYMHKLDGPCNCGEDHSAGYRIEPLRKPAPATPAKVTRAHRVSAPDVIHNYGAARLLRYGSGQGKRFVWQHDADGAGDWIDGLGDATPGFYRAAEIGAADLRKLIFIAGGEKCVDALVKRGAVAGCNPGGEGKGKWCEEYNALFVGRHVVILADADATGRAHAQAIADSLTGVAQSVRIIELEGAHDVADWLADGYTLLELLEIAACTLPVQNSSPGMSSSTGGAGETQNVSCLTCKRERELRQIAETSLANLRREQAMTSRILALPKEQLSPPLKPAAIAVRAVLSQPKARDEQGMELVYRRAISQRCGVSDETAGTYLRKLADAGVIRRDVRKLFDSTEIHISEGPLFNAPEQIASTPTTWGGKRTKKGCPHCHSIDIVPTSYGCSNCGAYMRPDELIDVPVEVEEAEPQEPAQDTPPPPDIIVPDLAPDGQTCAPDLNHRDKRAELLALVESLSWQTRIPVGLAHNEGGTWAHWQTFAAQADNALIDEALRALRIRAEAYRKVG